MDGNLRNREQSYLWWGWGRVCMGEVGPRTEKRHSIVQLLYFLVFELRECITCSKNEIKYVYLKSLVTQYKLKGAESPRFLVEWPT